MADDTVLTVQFAAGTRALTSDGVVWSWTVGLSSSPESVLYGLDPPPAFSSALAGQQLGEAVCTWLAERLRSQRMQGSELRVRLALSTTMTSDDPLRDVPWEELKWASVLTDCHTASVARVCRRRIALQEPPSVLVPKLLLAVAEAQPDGSRYGDLDPDVLAALRAALDAQQAQGALTVELIDLSEEGGTKAIVRLKETLQADYQVLCVIAHGDGERIQLVGADGKRETVELADFVGELSDITLPPLVVLLSCHSANARAYTSAALFGDALRASLAERLIEQCPGVRAVLALRGEVLQTTATGFVQRLLDALAKESNIEQAVAEVRNRVGGTPELERIVLTIGNGTEGILWRRDPRAKRLYEWLGPHGDGKPHNSEWPLDAALVLPDQRRNLAMSLLDLPILRAKDLGELEETLNDKLTTDESHPQGRPLELSDLLASTTRRDAQSIQMLRQPLDRLLSNHISFDAALELVRLVNDAHNKDLFDGQYFLQLLGQQSGAVPFQLLRHSWRHVLKGPNALNLFVEQLQSSITHKLSGKPWLQIPYEQFKRELDTWEQTVPCMSAFRHRQQITPPDTVAQSERTLPRLVCVIEEADDGVYMVRLHRLIEGSPIAFASSESEPLLAANALLGWLKQAISRFRTAGPINYMGDLIWVDCFLPDDLLLHALQAMVHSEPPPARVIFNTRPLSRYGADPARRLVSWKMRSFAARKMPGLGAEEHYIELDPATQSVQRTFDDKIALLWPAHANPDADRLYRDALRRKKTLEQILDAGLVVAVVLCPLQELQLAQELSGVGYPLDPGELMKRWLIARYTVDPDQRSSSLTPSDYPIFEQLASYRPHLMLDLYDDEEYAILRPLIGQYSGLGSASAAAAD